MDPNNPPESPKRSKPKRETWRRRSRKIKITPFPAAVSQSVPRSPSPADYWDSHITSEPSKSLREVIQGEPSSSSESMIESSESGSSFSSRAPNRTPTANENKYNRARSVDFGQEADTIPMQYPALAKLIQDPPSPQRDKRQSRGAKFFSNRRKSMAQRDDDLDYTERISGRAPAEQLIEEARVLILHRDFSPASDVLKRAVQIFEMQLRISQDSATRYSLACAQYFLADTLVALGEVSASELASRKALEMIDELLLSRSYSEGTKTILSDDWLLGVDLTFDLLWFRRSSIEHQLGSILQRQRMFEVALEWYQRSIFSREKQIHLSGMPASHANISWILIQYVARHVDIDYSERPKEIPVQRLQELISLLSVAKTHAKSAIKNCKKSSDDVVNLAACSNLLDIQILTASLMFSHGCQSDFASRRMSIMVNSKRQSKVEKIKKEIDRIQKRIAKDQRIPGDFQMMESPRKSHTISSMNPSYDATLSSISSLGSSNSEGKYSKVDLDQLRVIV